MKKLLLWPLLAAAAAASIAAQQALLSPADVVAMSHPAPDEKISYGAHPLRFGELRLPRGTGPHPVAIVVHGGCWLSQYDLGHVGSLAAGLTDAGYATWSMEYRRVGDEGGGWPGTFLDVARGADYVRTLARRYPLDESRLVAVGHSAGAQLALWLAARPQLPPDSELYTEHPLPISAVLALGSAPDLAMVHKAGSCGNVVDRLMGGSPVEHPERYAQVSPVELVPRVRQILINGAHDRWSAIADSYFEAATAAGAPIERIIAPESGHFELIVPTTTTWPIVRAAALKLLE